MSRWHPFTKRVPDEIDPANPRYEHGIDFVLTPQEQTQAAIIACQIRVMRDRQNKLDKVGEAEPSLVPDAEKERE